MTRNPNLHILQAQRIETTNAANTKVRHPQNPAADARNLARHRPRQDTKTQNRTTQRKGPFPTQKQKGGRSTIAPRVLREGPVMTATCAAHLHSVLNLTVLLLLRILFLNLELCVVHEHLLLEVKVMLRLDIDLIRLLVSLLQNEVGHLADLVARTAVHDCLRLSTHQSILTVPFLLACIQ